MRVALRSVVPIPVLVAAAWFVVMAALLIAVNLLKRRLRRER